MKNEIKTYLDELKEKFLDSKYQAYNIKDSKIELIGTAKTKNEIEEIITNNFKKIKDSNNIAIILYNIKLKDYLVGPLTMKCTIQKIVNNKISKKISDIKINSINFTEKELEMYKLKKGDYKLLIKKLLNGNIESNPFITYTRKDLD